MVGLLAARGRLLGLHASWLRTPGMLASGSRATFPRRVLSASGGFDLYGNVPAGTELDAPDAQGPAASGGFDLYGNVPAGKQLDAPVAVTAEAEQLPEVSDGSPVKLRDYMYSRKGEPPIMVKAHRRGLPNSKAADVSPAGESRFDLYDGDGMPSAVGKQLDAPDSQGHGGSRALSMARDLSTAEPPRPPLNRITFELRDIEGLPNFVVGKQLDGAAKELETWRLLKRAMDTKQEVYARVLQKTASGFMVDILGRVAFLPMSLSGQRDSVGSRDIDRTAGERDK